MRLQIKLSFSPVKWLVCFVFICIIPIAMYVPTYFDFINVSTMYLPFVGIVLFSDIAILDKGSRSEEIVFLSNKYPVKIFLERYLISLLLFLAYILLANGVFNFFHQFSSDKMIETISLFTYVANAAGGSLFIGAITMTISALLNSVYVGYGFSIIYWLYWNINCQVEALFNPFPFIANPTYYEVPLIMVYVLSFGLIISTCFIYRKSPFYFSDKIRKLICRFFK